MGKMKDIVMDRVEMRMDVLQEMMESQKHLESPAEVLDQIASISPYWSSMSDEDKDYVQCARWAIENKSEWNV